MSALELPTVLLKSPRSTGHGEEVFPQAEFQPEDSFTEPSFASRFAVGSPSSLEYSLREASLLELNARLRAEGFEPPGMGLAAWVRLARIVQVDAESVTVEELVQEACDWAERVRVTERIRMQVAGCGFGASSHSGERVVSGMDASAEQGVPV